MSADSTEFVFLDGWVRYSLSLAASILVDQIRPQTVLSWYL